MRVAIDVSAVPANPVGAGQYVLALVRALATRGAIDLLLWARRDDGPRWSEAAPAAEIAATAPTNRLLRLAWEQAVLPRALAQLAPTLHHAPHYTMPERARVPKVVTIHDLTFLDHPEWHERGKVPVFGRAIRVAARHADALVCVSQGTADRLQELCRPSGRVHVVRHGVDLERFRPATPDDRDADERALAALGVRPPYVAFLGTLEPRKNVPGLVRAFDAIADRHPELQLVVAGGAGWGAHEVEAAVGAARSAGRIVRTGYVPDAVAPVILRHAMAVAYPAFEEGFGLPALEAIACGVPLVTTTGTPMEEVAGEAALLVPPGDDDALAAAIDAVATGGADLAARVGRGLAIARAHTWDATAAGHEAVYRATVG